MKGESIMKKFSFVAMLAGSIMLLTACANGSEKAPITTTTTKETTTQAQTTQKESQTSAEDDFSKIIEDLCNGHTLVDSEGITIPDADYLPLPEFSELSSGSVFDVTWDTTEGSYTAGTSFLMKTNLTEEPLLITAIHYFGETDYISGEQLPDYVNGGELYDILKSGSEPDTTIKDVIPISDAVAIGAAESGDKDVAAFTVTDASSLTALPMASEPCKTGDMIFLAALLDNSQSDTYDDCLYPCVVIEDDGNELYYVLGDEFVTTGASGGPLLNSKGEVVGIHIASAGSVRYGHSIQSIYKQLEVALSAK